MNYMMYNIDSGLFINVWKNTFSFLFPLNLTVGYISIEKRKQSMKI